MDHRTASRVPLLINAYCLLLYVSPIVGLIGAADGVPEVSLSILLPTLVGLGVVFGTVLIALRRGRRWAWWGALAWAIFVALPLPGTVWWVSVIGAAMLMCLVAPATRRHAHIG